jgi:hypothetical protein
MKKPGRNTHTERGRSAAENSGVTGAVGHGPSCTDVCDLPVSRGEEAVSCAVLLPHCTESQSMQAKSFARLEPVNCYVDQTSAEGRRAQAAGFVVQLLI